MTPELEHAADRAPRHSVQREVGVLERGHGGGGGEGTSYVQPHWGHTVTPVAITAPHARHSVSSQITTVPHASQRKADIRSISTRSLPGAQKNKLITPGPGLILPGPEESGSSISRPERCSMPNRPQTIFALQVGHFIIRYVCHASCSPTSNYTGLDNIPFWGDIQTPPSADGTFIFMKAISIHFRFGSKALLR
jgi:hypothetical protein